MNWIAHRLAVREAWIVAGRCAFGLKGDAMSNRAQQKKETESYTKGCQVAFGEARRLCLDRAAEQFLAGSDTAAHALRSVAIELGKMGVECAASESRK